MRREGREERVTVERRGRKESTVNNGEAMDVVGDVGGHGEEVVELYARMKWASCGQGCERL